MSEAKERMVDELTESGALPLRWTEFAPRIAEAIEALIDERILQAVRAQALAGPCEKPKVAAETPAGTADITGFNSLAACHSAEPPAGGQRRPSFCAYCGVESEPQPSAEAEGTFGQHDELCALNIDPGSGECDCEGPQPPTPPSAGAIALPVRLDSWLPEGTADITSADGKWKVRNIELTAARQIAAALNRGAK